MGYTPGRVRLPGTKGDELDLERAAEARRQTQARLAAFETPRAPLGTWARPFHRYRTDEFSPYHEVKADTPQSYHWPLERWTKAIGYLPVGASFRNASACPMASANARRRSGG